MGLSAPDHAYDAQRSGLDEQRPAPGREVVGTLSGAGRSRKTAPNPQPASPSGRDTDEPPETHAGRLNGSVASYRYPLAASA
jgi:hypothetical protein